MISKEDLHLYDDLFLKEDNKPLFPNINIKIKKYILTKLLMNEFNINFNDLEWKSKDEEHIEFKNSTFLKLNEQRINEDGTFKEEFFSNFYKKFTNLKKENNSELKLDDEKNDILESVSKDVYKIEKHHTIADIYQCMYNSEGFCKFVYFDNHKNNGLKKQYPTNITTLQRFEIKINSKKNIYDHLAKLHYRCNCCGHEFYKSFKELESTNLKTECPNIITTADGQPKLCKKALSKPTKISKVVNINVYDATIMGENNVPENILVESMEELKPFIYDAVGFRLQEDGEKYLFLLDYVPIDGNKLYFNEIKYIKNNKLIIRDKNDVEDIIPYWMNYFDSKIKELSGDDVLGMYDIKFAMLIQKMCSIFYTKYNFFNLNYNIALLGDNDSGKTWTIEHYGYLLYGGLMKSTNGESVSIPALRGSAKSNRDIKKGNKNIPGLLTQYNLILIDEIDKASDDLMGALKSTLLKPTFANDKADGDKTEYTRTAHINITENIQESHVGMIQGEIKKEYESLYSNPLIERVGDEPEKFNYKWDIFQHIDDYDNMILKQAIINIREKYAKKKTHYLDGREHAVHDRFPFWYVMRKTENDEIIKSRQDSVVDKMLNNTKMKDFIAINKMLQQLTIDNIDDFFKLFDEFILGKYENNLEIKDKLRNIVKEYDSNKTTVSRIMSTLVMILNCSRILNLRKDFNEVDYNYVRRYLYMRDRIVNYDEFNDMSVFNISKTKPYYKEYNNFETNNNIFDNNIDDDFNGVL